MQHFIFLYFVLSFNLLFGYPDRLVHAWNEFLFNPTYCKVLEASIDSRQTAFPIERLDALLNDYTAPNLEQSVLNMLVAELQIDPAKIKIQEIPEREGEEPVFRIYDEQNRLIMIVKGFGDNQGFLAEISGEEKIYAMNLPHVQAPAPIAVGKIYYKNIKLWVLAQTVASGKMLGHVAMEKNAVLLAKALKALALTTAELQLEGNRQTSILQNREDCWLYFLTFSSIPFPYLEESTKALNNFSDELEEKVRVDFTHESTIYIHGDYHWGNIFYNDTTDEIELIDLPTFRLTKVNRELEEMDVQLRNLKLQLLTCIIFFKKGVYLFEDLLALEEEYALAYGRIVSHLKPDLPGEVFEIFWKMCALWTHLSEEIEQYEELHQADESTAKEKLQQAENRVNAVILQMEAAQLRF